MKVVHCKREPYDVLIARPSKWGNPFKIGKDGTREEVIAKYRAWVLTQPELMAALPELRGKTLGCWCKPKACHGDVLAELAGDAGQAVPRRKALGVGVAAQAHERGLLEAAREVEPGGGSGGRSQARVLR